MAGDSILLEYGVVSLGNWILHLLGSVGPRRLHSSRTYCALKITHYVPLKLPSVPLSYPRRTKFYSGR